MAGPDPGIVHLVLSPLRTASAWVWAVVLGVYFGAVMTGFGLVSEHEHPVRAVIGGVIAALLAGLADR